MTLKRVSVKPPKVAIGGREKLPNRPRIAMKEMVDVLATANGSKAERLAAQRAFLKKRGEIWKDIQEGRFPATYISAESQEVHWSATEDGNPLRLPVG